MKFKKYILSALFLLILTSGTNAQVLLINDFESYAGEAELRNEWTAFGAASADQPYISNESAAGSQAALVPVDWSNGNFSLLEFEAIPSGASDLNLYSSIDVFANIKTTDSNGLTSPTTLLLAIRGGSNGTVWQTRSDFAETPTIDSYSQLSFSLLESEMEFVDGVPDTFSNTISNVSDIMLRFENSSGGGTQELLFDNLTAVPEPSSFALLVGLCGFGFIFCRRIKKVGS